MIGYAVNEMLRIKAEHDAFERLCDSLPEEMANKLKSERSARQKEDMEHRRALEIAEAGRARNFWGK